MQWGSVCRRLSPGILPSRTKNFPQATDERGSILWPKAAAEFETLLTAGQNQMLFAGKAPLAPDSNHRTRQPNPTTRAVTEHSELERNLIAVHADDLAIVVVAHADPEGDRKGEQLKTREWYHWPEAAEGQINRNPE